MHAIVSESTLAKMIITDTYIFEPYILNMCPRIVSAEFLKNNFKLMIDENIYGMSLEK